MQHHARVLLAASTPDVGPGEAWPAAVFAGAFHAASLAAGAWLAVAAVFGDARIGLGEWIALHAALGLASGVLGTWIVALGRRFDVALTRPELRRAAAVRLSSLGAAAAIVCFAYSLRPDLRQAACVAAGLGVGGALAWLASRRIVFHDSELGAVPRFDPLRVAALLALLMVPLQGGAVCSSPGEAWRVMLGP